MRLIDADAFRRELDDHYPFTKDEQSKHGMADIAKSAVLFVLNKMPTIDPEQRKGNWIATHEVTPFSNPDSITYVCSECGHKHYTLYCLKFDMKYCSDCGAKMEVGE